MALKQAYLEYINTSIIDTLGQMRGKRMLEMGNQEIKDNSIVEKTGKEFFTKQGIEHVSVDLNGLDGALPLDLTKPEQFKGMQGRFDIITNAGTSEHVEPKNSQYECFSIIHDCLRAGGIAVHLLPDIDELKNRGRWRWHSFNYYSHDFFRMLAEKNNYRLVSLKIVDGLICSCLQKIEDAPFMADRKEFLGYISRRPIGIIYPDINDRGFIRFLYGPVKFLKNIFNNLNSAKGRESNE